MDMSEQYTHRNRNQMSRIDLSFNDRQVNQSLFQRGGHMNDAADMSNEDFTQMQKRMAMIRDAYDRHDEHPNQMAEDEDQRTESDYHG